VTNVVCSAPNPAKVVGRKVSTVFVPATVTVVVTDERGKLVVRRPPTGTITVIFWLLEVRVVVTKAGPEAVEVGTDEALDEETEVEVLFLIVVGLTRSKYVEPEVVLAAVRVPMTTSPSRLVRVVKVGVGA